ncbi:1636_t:CDS:2 [Paraglomus brasilianum]|uniref:1636_t:CDS:1 n=1 Tax=Paraglomus brasilianum TaxID=144538 RepID=A0A9N8YXR3_9GLOM|nr:1636_t:CDS:2 [Paraglomus brasilianum]
MEDRYIVDDITAVKNKEYFLVKWEGFTKETWEPRENLDHCEEKLARFYEIMRDSNLDKDWQLQRHLTKDGTEFETRMHRAYHESKLFDSAAYDNCILKKGVSEQQKRDAGKRIEEIQWIDLNVKRRK